MNLTQLGWRGSDGVPAPPPDEPDFRLARVAREDRGRSLVIGEFESVSATVAGRLRHHAGSRLDLPVVGDWVDVRLRPGEGRGRIVGVRPRRTLIRRKAPGATSEEQPLAANVDVVFLVTGLDGNYRLRRIERYLTLAWESGAQPVVVLSKADLVAEPENFVREAGAVAPGVEVVAASSVTGEGLDAIRRHLGPGVTGVFLGSSGVGKSTLVNRLLGEERLETREVREDDSKGRHTTTRRELLLLPGEGGIVIDTPGLREIQLAGDEDDLGGSFADVEEIAAICRFRDCRHGGEPGCAVAAALGDGALDPDRYESYLQHRRELAFQERRRNQAARLTEERKWRRITLNMRQRRKLDPGKP